MLSGHRCLGLKEPFLVTLVLEGDWSAKDMWQKGVMHNFMSYFKMNQLGCAGKHVSGMHGPAVTCACPRLHLLMFCRWNNMLDNNFADNRNWGCHPADSISISHKERKTSGGLDEFWYVTALF